MDFKEIKELIELVNNTDLTEVEIKNGDMKISIKREKEMIQSQVTQVMPQMLQPTNQVQVVQQEISTKESPLLATEDNKNIHTVTSPIVGTFYASPSPTTDDFVKEGSAVQVGDILCIIEAMKLMNEIESDVSGEITEVLINNEDLVEYGQPLFKLRIN